MNGKLSAVSRRPESTPEELDERRASGLARVGRLIGRLQASGFFGKITVSLQNGVIVEVRNEQVLKVDDL
jgi:hypothetical protein